TSRVVRPIISASTSSGTLHEASGTVPPLGWRKLAFRFLPAPGPECAVRLRLRLDDALMHEQTVLAAVKGRHDIRKVTFTSSIDGSVQYYGLNPARRDDGPAAPALVLSLHGASVEAIGQAHAYGRKDWCHVVCPTNRRPYGFDWEDWGRQDALEVLAHAQASLRHDPSRVYLTGHSMGGHGTWTVGAHFPDRFAAIAPSAGWQSFWTYSGGGIAVPEGDAVGAVLRRASNPSDTLLMKDNYRRQAVYILHGDADETVPVTEARAMRDALAPFHKDMQCFEHPGGAHWWDNDSEPGAACVDWPGFFDLFAARRLPAAAEIREFSFTTVCPGNSATCYWATIVQQQRPLLPSRVDLRCDPQSRLVRGLTDNARRVALDLSHLEPGNPVTIALDDSGPGELPWPKNGVFNLLRTEAGWQESALPATEKNPARGGGFKNAMRNRFVLVYGTGGNETEQRAAFDKARLDAEQFGYRGNGSVEVMPDTEFDPALEPGRCVVLYGNADTNRHWQTLLAGSPVTVSRGKVTVGSVSMDGDHSGLLLARPHPLHSGSMVAAVGATGADGMRATLRLPYFLAGTGVPDFVVLTADLPSKGLEGVQAAGFFGNDWSYVASESAWR
ncbi:MAG: prolyl oligopeptidase family serine peptidase, partial [Planctomycetes bacterium]|nr:prolyl oligopeptidase family serine peptidase [Planctomycetota bacterium]